MREKKSNDPRLYKFLTMKSKIQKGILLASQSSRKQEKKPQVLLLSWKTLEIRTHDRKIVNKTVTKYAATFLFFIKK